MRGIVNMLTAVGLLLSSSAACDSRCSEDFGVDVGFWMTALGCQGHVSGSYHSEDEGRCVETSWCDCEATCRRDYPWSVERASFKIDLIGECVKLCELRVGHPPFATLAECQQVCE